ncbi:hypothetical protein [Amycolatopsis sp. cmx-4-68]|uniref:hypothetical protein n=1 Tax=Amycolatopsis sp. cmx-4-68 TaxID=2790938 RepID=UPI00397ADAEB
MSEGAEVVARLANPETWVLGGAYDDGRLPAKAYAAASIRRRWRGCGGSAKA